MLLRISIVGRPNVGKSTLFNRLFGKRRALVHDEPGVTRDRLEESAEWWLHGKKYVVHVVDTGGLGGTRFAAEITHQVNLALEKSDVVLFLFDGQEGLTSEDRSLLRGFTKAGLKEKARLIGVINKVDHPSHESRINEFYASGLDDLLTISAEHGRGIDDLKEAVLIPWLKAHPQDEIAVSPLSNVTASSEKMDQDESEDKDQEDSDFDEDSDYENSEDRATMDRGGLLRLAIMGRPNVGKSTLVNALMREERVITSPIAGTTVDSIDLVANISGRNFVLIDTAGIRRKGKTEQGIEVLSVIQSQKALERSDVALLLLDGETGITEQDEKIAGMIEESGCSVILVMNKWDTQKKNQEFSKEDAAKRIREEMGFLKYAPILFISALKEQGLASIADLVEEIRSQRQLKIATHEFTEWVRKESAIHNPSNVKFYLCHQSGRHPPTFVCHVNDPLKIHFSLKRYLMNALRRRWGFMGSPVRLLFIEGKNRKSLPKNRKKPQPKLKPKIIAQTAPARGGGARGF